MLIDKTIDTTTAYVSFQANNAAEMAQKLTEWFISNPTLVIWDIELNASGAAPVFLCTLTVGDINGGGALVLLASFANVEVVGGQGQLDAEAMATEIGVLVRASAPGADGLNKVVHAVGGFGPHWMAIALHNGPER